MASVKSYQVYLSFEDVVDMEIRHDRGRVVAFSCNYRAFIRGKWKEVVRYDTTHGHLHVHRFWLPKARQRRRLERTSRPAAKRDYSQMVSAAQQDIRIKWLAYRQKMER